jgi:hypothetical protein
MLEFSLYYLKCDMIFKIAYRSKFNKDHFKFSDDFEKHITFGKTQDPPCSIILGRLCSGLRPQLMNINNFFPKKYLKA